MLSSPELLTVWRPVCDCAASALCVLLAVDLCDPGPQCCCAKPTQRLSLAPGRGGAAGWAGVVLGQSLNGWRVTIGLDNLL